MATTTDKLESTASSTRDGEEIDGSPSPGGKVACLSEEDVTINGLLGRGSFSSVFEVSTDKVHSAVQDSKVYALKRINKTILKSPKRTVAIDDFVAEGQLLMNLPRHTNIVTLLGISDSFFDAPISGFLVMEYLPETLAQRMSRWRTEQVASAPMFKIFKKNPGARSRAKMVGTGVASAISFLHGRRLLYRDLKPANVGFDTNGLVRLFDFGLCRHYDANDNGNKLTRCVGSPRYMAPEVVSGKNYDFSADVHSFAILLWEVGSLKKPFAHVETLDQLRQNRKKRPSLKQISDKNLQTLIRACWDGDPNARPSMALVLRELQTL